MSELPENLTAVREAHVFDEARLAAFMTANVEGYRAPTRVLQFEADKAIQLSSDRYRRAHVRAAQEAAGQALALGAPGGPRYRVIKALSDHSDVPVPKPMRFARTMGDRHGLLHHGIRARPHPGRPQVARRFTGRPAKIFDSMNDVLARIHNVDYRAAGLGDFGARAIHPAPDRALVDQYDLSRRQTSKRWSC